MHKLSVTPLLGVFVALAGCTSEPILQRDSNQLAVPSKPATAAKVEIAPIPVPVEAAQAVVTRIVVSGLHDRTDPLMLSTTEQATGSPSLPIFATASLYGHGRVKLTAIWQYQSGATFGRTDTWVTLAGSSVTVFHVDNPHLWPLGWYQVEVEVNDQRAPFTGQFKVTTQGIISEGNGVKLKFPPNQTHVRPHP